MRHLIAMLLPLALLAYGCSSAAADRFSVDVSCDEFARSTSITRQATPSAGDSLAVNFCSNPGTRFSWEDAVISDGAVVEQVSRQSVPSGSGRVGSSGQETWTFRALRKGKAAVSTAYSRPWAGGEKGVWTFRMEVEVR